MPTEAASPSIPSMRLYELDNNSVLQWIENGDCDIIGRTPQEVYTDYCLYSDNSNTMPVQIRKFNVEVKKKLTNYDIEHSMIDNESIYKWIKKD